MWTSDGKDEVLKFLNPTSSDFFVKAFPDSRFGISYQNLSWNFDISMRISMRVLWFGSYAATIVSIAALPKAITQIYDFGIDSGTDYVLKSSHFKFKNWLCFRSQFFYKFLSWLRFFGLISIPEQILAPEPIPESETAPESSPELTSQSASRIGVYSGICSGIGIDSRIGTSSGINYEKNIRNWEAPIPSSHH